MAAQVIECIHGQPLTKECWRCPFALSELPRYSAFRAGQGSREVEEGIEVPDCVHDIPVTSGCSHCWIREPQHSPDDALTVAHVLCYLRVVCCESDRR